MSKIISLMHFALKKTLEILHTVHSPTNALLYFKNTLKFTLKYTEISLLHVSVFDHHQGACTEPG